MELIVRSCKFSCRNHGTKKKSEGRITEVHWKSQGGGAGLKSQNFKGKCEKSKLVSGEVFKPKEYFIGEGWMFSVTTHN